jgi:hypothetical protein
MIGDTGEVEYWPPQGFSPGTLGMSMHLRGDDDPGR